MAIFRPDPHPEIDCLDGEFIGGGGGETTWAAVRTGLLGDILASDGANSNRVSIKSDSGSGKWAWLRRGVAGFNTATIPDDITILSATLSLYGAAKEDLLSVTPDINVYSTTLTDNTNIAGSDAQMLTDYQAFGSTAFSTAISYASWDTSGWNDFDLNAAGLAYISKTGVTNFGIRTATYDASGNIPAWTADKESGFTWLAADFSDGSFAPKLTVIYTISTMTAGNFAIVEERAHYVSKAGIERYNLGIEIGASAMAKGNIAAVEERFQYVGATSQKERYILGVEIGNTSLAAGNIGVVEERFHYAAGGKERYWLGTPV